MLPGATFGMLAYGLYSVVGGITYILNSSSLELWASLGLILLGLMLIFAAAFVRVLLPGGIHLALGAMLGLQSLALHNADHFYEGVAVLPQLARAGLSVSLVFMAYRGSQTVKKKGAPLSED